MKLRMLAAAVSVALSAWAAGPERIAVSPDGHFLQSGDGKPFFWLADTAWLLLSKLDREETVRYLEDRKNKGFTVIQVMVLHAADDRTAGGSEALLGGNLGRPNVAPGGYWEHLDWVIDRAGERGIYVGLVTAWGSLAKGGQLNAGNAEAYATFLARRYRGKPNVVWILGGDIQGDLHQAMWSRMGEVLKAEDPGHLITFHPFGRMQSSTWFHEKPWLDFNLFQSGHQRYNQDVSSPHRYGEDNWRYVREDYARNPVKPVIDGEPSYENIPQGLHDAAQPYWTAADCRRYAWWLVFAGAAGHTYGSNSIMQFFRKGDSPAYGARETWVEALGNPGAGQMQFLKKLMLSRPYFERVPDQTLIAGENGARYEYVTATRGRSYAMAYTYTGRPFEVKMGLIRGSKVRAQWYSPRDGSAREIGTMANKGTVKFVPPGAAGAGNDWVLVLDDAVAGWK